MNEYKHVLLLRAFGDFIIAINLAVKNQSSHSFCFVASKHFEPLFNALNLEIPPNFSIQFVDFAIKNNILGYFTNRYLFSTNTIKQLNSLRQYVQQHPINGHYYLEHKKRIKLLSKICSHSFNHIIDEQNVYQGFASFFNTSLEYLENIPMDFNQSNLRILVLPDARQQKRKMSPSLLMLIKNRCNQKGFKLSLGVFGDQSHHQYDSTIHVLRYRDFNELIQLIQSFDIIIGTDSMPIHLAQFLQKPHYILYPKYVKNQFFTPFALKHQSYFTFEKILAEQSFFLNGK